MPSLQFLWWAIGLALTAGFGLGMALFLALALRLPIGAWWPAAVQAHGHVQLYSWGGMFALGIGLYFLPWLRGCPPPSPRLIRLAATLMGTGLALRGLLQPLSHLPDERALRLVVLIGVWVSGPLELAGAALAVWALVSAARKGPPLRTRAALLPVLPFALCFFVALPLGLVLNTIALTFQVFGLWTQMIVVTYSLDWTIVHLGLNGMLVAICAAVAARTFPLYLRLRVPRPRELYVVASVFFAGFLLRSTAPFGVSPTLAGASAIGSLLEGVAFVGLAGILDVPFRRTRRDLAGREGPPRSEDRAAEWLIVAAYAWLAVAGLLLAWEGVAGLVSLSGSDGLTGPPRDAERHALGAGLVTLLILGMAVRLVPGFVGRPLYSARLVWATVWLGNGAALLRVAPLFLPSSPLTLSLLGLAGALGLAAVACLGWNLWRTVRG